MRRSWPQIASLEQHWCLVLGFFWVHGLDHRAVSAISGQSEGEACMRAHYIIAVVAVIVIGFGVKLFFFSVPIAEADTGATISIQEMHSNAHMEGAPVQTFQAH